MSLGPLRYQSFPARCADQGPDPRTRSWITARSNGFLQTPPDDEQLVATAQAWQAEGRTLHAIYDDSPRPRAALGDDVPVATLATFEAALDAGGTASIPCTLVADVTVRPTHQGQGLMRRLMDAVTAQTVEAGVPLQALHAAHPALYARFGFAPTIRAAAVEVTCDRFRLRDDPPGMTHEADPSRAEELARTVAAAARAFRFGALDLARPLASRPPGPDDGRRCLVHVDADGTVDGVLSYVFRGWTPQSQVLEVLSETYSTLAAHAALWQTVCGTGIASTVRAGDVRPDDPLPWMLRDSAAWRVLELSDGASLRILDPVRALQLRGYSGPDTQLTLEVTDRTGQAGGRWLVRVSGGQAAVEVTSRRPDVTLDARELAATFLATTRTTTLLDAGLAKASRGAANALDAMLRWPVEASSSLHF